MREWSSRDGGKKTSLSWTEDSSDESADMDDFDCTLEGGMLGLLENGIKFNVCPFVFWFEHFYWFLINGIENV